MQNNHLVAQELINVNCRAPASDTSFAEASEVKESFGGQRKLRRSRKLRLAKQGSGHEAKCSKYLLLITDYRLPRERGSEERYNGTVVQRHRGKSTVVHFGHRSFLRKSK